MMPPMNDCALLIRALRNIRNGMTTEDDAEVIEDYINDLTEQLVSVSEQLQRYKPRNHHGLETHTQPCH